MKWFELEDFDGHNIKVNIDSINMIALNSGCLESYAPCIYDKDIRLHECKDCKYHGYNIIIHCGYSQFKVKGTKTLEETKKIRDNLLDNMMKKV